MIPYLTFVLDGELSEHEPAVGEKDPHKLFGAVIINGQRHYIHLWRVVDDEQSPHPDMDPEMQDWYHEMTAETSPDTPRQKIQLPGREGDWVLVIAP